VFAVGYWWGRAYVHRWSFVLIGILVTLGTVYLPRGLGGLGSIVAIVFGGLLLATAVISPSRFAGWLSQPLLLLSTSTVVYFVTPEIVPSTEFYKAAAQVLPVLFLVFIVDKRREFHRSESVDQRFANVMVIIWIVAAGHETFQVLAFDNTSRGDARYVYAAFVVTVTVLFVSLLTPPVQEVSAELEGGIQSSDPKPDPEGPM